MVLVRDRWQKTQQAIGQATDLVGINLNGLTVGEQPVDLVINALIGQLKALRGMLAARDTVALADCAALRVAQTVDQWDQLLGTVIDAIEQAADPDSEDHGSA